MCLYREPTQSAVYITVFISSVFSLIYATTKINFIDDKIFPFVSIVILVVSFCCASTVDYVIDKITSRLKKFLIEKEITMLIIEPPKRFVGLHAHSGFSNFDGLSYPADHIKFITSDAQGMDAWALTDHGNGNGHAHAHSAAKKVQKSGKKYRQLYGVEFYFVPSLTQWKIDYEAHKQSVKDAKSAAEAAKKSAQKTDEDADDEEEDKGHVIENEEETKADDYKEKPTWQKRYHLVAVAKNQTGLKNLYRLVKLSFKDGFYRYPRIDYDLIKKYGEGIVWSTACLGGYGSGIILQGEAYGKTSQQILSELQNMTDRFVDAVGRDNFFLELQFNRLPKQHIVNAYMMELANQTGLKLIATCDSHYPDPSKWQARELYKKLGWLGTQVDAAVLPKFEDLKCELYPKNAQQMWDEYTKSYSDWPDIYANSEQIVKDAIERTHDIAWQMCEDTWVDTSAKLPKLAKEGESEFNQLAKLVKEALIKEGMSDKPEYVERAKKELSDIKYLGHAAYFLTMYRIFHDAEKATLFGPGRGSGPGSLVNYLLGITQIDPLKYSLLWERFLGRHRVSWPDIDSDAGNRDALIDSARKIFGEDAVIPVSNFNTLKLKSLVKDVAKIMGVPFEEVNAVTGPLQTEVEPLARDENQEKSVFVLQHDDCMQYSKRYREFMDKYPDVKEHIETLFMQNRSVGRHAGGVIVAEPDDIASNMPIIGVRGELQTSWTEGMNFRNLEDNGFLKFDFLGLTLLDDVENCIRRILESQGKTNVQFSEIKEFFDTHLNCRYVSQDDSEVWKHVYHEGRFVGVFQFTACLVGDTLVTLSDGTQEKLENIIPGQHVLSYNADRDIYETKRVSNYINQGKKECVELQFQDGKTITCTLDHKFFTSNRGWVTAEDLDTDDEIVEHDIKLFLVTSAMTHALKTGDIVFSNTDTTNVRHLHNSTTS